MLMEHWLTLRIICFCHILLTDKQHSLRVLSIQIQQITVKWCKSSRSIKHWWYQENNRGARVTYFICCHLQVKSRCNCAGKLKLDLSCEIPISWVDIWCCVDMRFLTLLPNVRKQSRWLSKPEKHNQTNIIHIAFHIVNAQVSKFISQPTLERNI